MAYVEEFIINSNTYLDIKKINGVRSYIPIKEVFTITLNPFRKEFWTQRTSYGSDVFPIKPGPCTLDLKYNTPMGYADGQVSFNAQAGHTYIIKTKSHVTGKWFRAEWIKFSVEDKKNIRKKPLDDF